jgi:hypothetical protein
MAKRKKKAAALTANDKNQLRRILNKVRKLRGKKPKTTSKGLADQFAALSQEYQISVAGVRGFQMSASKGGIRTPNDVINFNAASTKLNNASNNLAVFVQMNPSFLAQLKSLLTNVHI